MPLPLFSPHPCPAACKTARPPPKTRPTTPPPMASTSCAAVVRPGVARQVREAGRKGGRGGRHREPSTAVVFGCSARPRPAPPPPLAGSPPPPRSVAWPPLRRKGGGVEADRVGRSAGRWRLVGGKQPRGGGARAPPGRAVARGMGKTPWHRPWEPGSGPPWPRPATPPAQTAGAPIPPHSEAGTGVCGWQGRPGGAP